MSKGKVLNLFGDNKNNLTTDQKYAVLLEEFIKPFESMLTDFEYLEDVYEFAKNAWNLGNMYPIIDKSEYDNIILLSKKNGEDYQLLEKMTKYKVKHLKDFTDFVIDFHVDEKNGKPTLKVVTQDEDTYLSELLGLEHLEENTNGNFEENFINRSAISLKPLQPFIDWHNTIYSDSKIDETDLEDVNIYLISNATYYEDVKAHLKKKFDNYFQRELEGWHTNKKEWPQRRNYKMFKEWFQINISTAVLDLEKTPVSKSE